MNPQKGKDIERIRTEEILDPWQIKRKQRMALIMKMLKSRNEVDEKEFLGFISVEYGVRRQTLIDYLTDLQDYGAIEIIDGKIRWLSKKQSDGGESTT